MASTSSRLLAPRTVERSRSRVLISVPALFPSGIDVKSRFLCISRGDQIRSASGRQQYQKPGAVVLKQQQP